MNHIFATLTAIALVPSLFFAFALSVRKQNILANRFLAVANALMCIFLGGHFSYYILGDRTPIPWLLFTTSMGFVFWPCIFLYTAFMISYYDKYTNKLLYHFAPALAYIALITAHGWTKGFFIDVPGIAELPLSARVIVSMRGVFGIFYIVWAITIARRHAKLILHYFSGIERVSLRWLQSLLLASFAMAGIVGLRFTLELLEVDASVIATITVIYYLTFTFWSYLVGYFAITQPEIFGQAQELKKALVESPALVEEHDSTPVTASPPSHAKDKSEHKTKQLFDDDKATELLDDLKALMEVDQLYLDGSLTLAQVAGKLSLSTHQLSYLLNNYLEKNFYTYVNSYRIEAAKHKLEDPANTGENIIIIAYDCGFQSKSPFNTFFKKVTGVTPTEYRKQFLAGERQSSPFA